MTGSFFYSCRKDYSVTRKAVQGPAAGILLGK